MLVSNPRDLLIPILEERFQKYGKTNASGNKRAKQNRKGKKHKTAKNLRKYQSNINNIDLIVDSKETDDIEHNSSIHWDYGTNRAYYDEEKTKKAIYVKEKWMELRKPKPPMQDPSIQHDALCGSPSNGILL